jgi:predicted secreted protein
MRHRRRLVGLVTAGMLMASCGDGTATVSLSADGVTEAEVGDELVIELAENPSVGDAWQVTTPPDGSVARLVGDTYEADEADPEMTGVGGTRSFTLEAIGSGETVLVVHNCYRCDAAGNTPPEDAHEARDLGYRILVR